VGPLSLYGAGAMAAGAAPTGAPFLGAIGLPDSAGVAPVSVLAPVATGVAQNGQALVSTIGIWSGTVTGYAFQWQRADNAGFTTNVTAIGTNSYTYTLTASEVGKYVRCVVTALGAGASGAAASNVLGSVSDLYTGFTRVLANNSTIRVLDTDAATIRVLN
jgi:hypothetical protein